MPKNSRPDIQVLEDRIVRLKAQLLEYKDLRLYKATKRRLASVSSELEECISIINEIVDAGTNNISSSSMSAYDVYPGTGLSEFSADGDLLDTSLLTDIECPSYTQGLSNAEIVSNYSHRLKQCSESIGCRSGILQVNQFCQVLNSWYQARFTPRLRNPNFYFKARRIHEWIDLMMIAAGNSIHQKLFPEFINDIDSWVRDLNTPKDQGYILPYSVMHLKAFDASICTQEAALLEIMLKPHLYDANFYETEMNSVRKIVMNNSDFSSNDLKVKQILDSCSSNLIVTSSFDASKYEEE